MKLVFRQDPLDDWSIVLMPASTQCKHGTQSCARCGTREATDVIHRARTPDKRTLRRLRRKGKR